MRRYAVPQGQLREPLAAARAQARDRDVGHGGQHVQSLATDGSGGAQDDEVLADIGGAGHGGKPTTAATPAALEAASAAELPYAAGVSGVSEPCPAPPQRWRSSPASTARVETPGGRRFSVYWARTATTG